jgi:hypothetical protein
VWVDSREVRAGAAARTLDAEVLLLLVVQREVLELLDVAQVLLDLLHDHVGVALAKQKLEQDQALHRVVLSGAVLDALPDESHDRGELHTARSERRVPLAVRARAGDITDSRACKRRRARDAGSART